MLDTDSSGAKKVQTVDAAIFPDLAGNLPP